MNQDPNIEKDLFSEALELPPDQREVFLQGACRSDEQLRQRVEDLLRVHGEASCILKTGAEQPTIFENPRVLEGPGTIIGRYKLLQKIGEGGCGVVYMAEQEEPVRRRVALKIIKLGMDTRQVIARFEAERQALALMDHPNIAKVHDAGATETGRPYFVMELVRGVKITEYCDEKKLTTQQRLELFTQVCRAVQHAHQKAIIHRDLKPSNILVSFNDGVAVPKVIDFGIAKATTGEPLTKKTVFTAFEQFIGTPAYMSPEQALVTNLDIDTRSDIYSLGVLLYELLTGQTPFDPKELLKSGVEAMRRTICEREPERPSTRVSTLPGEELTTTAKRRGLDAPKLASQLRGDLDWIVMKALEKDRNRRYETANAFASDIQRHLNNEPVAARPPSNLYRFQKLVRRNKLALTAGSAVTAAVLIGFGVSTWMFFREREAKRLQVNLRQHAQTEARRAEATARELKMSLSTSDFLQGLRFIADGNGNNALAFLGRSLTANPTNDAALAALATWLTYHSWMAPTLTLKHDEALLRAEFSPDGKRIVTAAIDGKARVFDAQKGQRLTEMVPGDGLDSVHFSPDGKRILTTLWEGTVRLWDAQTGQPLTEPMKHGSTLTSAQFSSDGKRIVTASRDNTARLWDAQTGQPLTEPMKHAGWVSSAQFSPDGKRIVTASEDTTARVWDAQTGQALTEPMKHRGEVVSAHFSPDGKQILTTLWDGTARMWDAQTGQALAEPMKHDSNVVSAQSSPDGKRSLTGLPPTEIVAQFNPDGKRILAASGDTAARVWDAQTGLPLTQPMTHGRSIYTAQFSRDGTRIVTTSYDRTTRVWDAQTGQPQGEPMRFSFRPNSAQFSPDGKRAVITAAYQDTVDVWDVQSGQALAEPMTHSGSVSSAQFSPDGKRIVTASADKTARVWNALTGQPLTEPMKHAGNVLLAQFSPDGTRIVTLAGNQARAWDAQTGLPLTEPMIHGTNTISAHFSPDGKRIVTTSFDKTARLWDAQTGQPLTLITHSDGVHSAEFSPEGKRIVTTSWDHPTAHVWDALTGRPITGPLRHDNTVLTAQFSADGNRVITTSYDGTARIWDAHTGQQITAPFKHVKGTFAVRSAQFSPDGKRLLTASDDRTARVWDVQTGQQLTEVKCNDGLASAQFSSDGKRILTSASDGTARVWDAQTGQPLTEPMKQNMLWWSPAQFSPDGKRILTSDDNAARVWDVAPTQGPYPDWLLPLSEAISGLALNQQGLLEPTKLNRAEILNKIRERLDHDTGDDDWVIWGRWLLADRATRTISPFSKITVPEYLEHRKREDADHRTETIKTDKK